MPAEDAHDAQSTEPIAEWMVIPRRALSAANNALAEMVPGLGGFKALHLTEGCPGVEAGRPHMWRLTREQCRELQQKVGKADDGTWLVQVTLIYGSTPDIDNGK